MDALIRYAGIAACGVVVLGCICRIGLMQSKHNLFSHFLLYALFGVFALALALDLVNARPVHWYVAAGVAGMLLYLQLTRRKWHDGPPPETRSDSAPLGRD